MHKLIILLASVMLIAGCGTDPEPQTEDVAETAPAATEQTERRQVRQRAARDDAAEANQEVSQLLDPARQMPRLSGELDGDGYGLTMLIDGSSPRAFQQSLELIASDTSDEQFQSLNSALRYLQAYTLGPGDLTEFYKTLDNRSGEEVIEMARQRRAQRGR